MSLREILIHMDSNPRCAARLELAVELAKRHGARLIGLYVLTHTAYTSRNTAADTQVKAAEAMFLERTVAADIAAEWRRIDWPVVGVSIGEVITLHAYYADLVVVGQTEDGKTGRTATVGIPELVILGSGRPVLIVPYAGSFRGMGQRVMVAWKAGRESTRALNDSLPLLQAAQEVTLMTVFNARDDAPLPDTIRDHLKVHGVSVRGKNIPACNLPMADTLLNYVAEEGIDLLVTGAYGHSFLGAPTLSIVARQLLKCMTVPVLMSH